MDQVPTYEIKQAFNVNDSVRSIATIAELYQKAYIPIFKQVDPATWKPDVINEQNDKFVEMSCGFGEYKKHDILIFNGKYWTHFKAIDYLRFRFESWVADKKIVPPGDEVLYNTITSEYSSPQIQGLWCVWQDACSTTISG